MAARRKYSAEFKREGVEMTKVAGITVGQVAQELGINGNMLGR
jgi:transposase-like protein